jgi:hypothetical protein
MDERAEDIAALLDLDDEEFTDVVLTSFRIEEDWKLLLAPEVIGRTLSALGDLQTRAQQRCDDLHVKLHSSAGWRQVDVKRALGKATSHRKVVEVRKGLARQAQRDINRARNDARTEAKEVRRTARLPELERETMAVRDAVRLLTLAIQRHRLAAVDSGLTPEPADRALWAVLDEVKVPLGPGLATLTEILGRGSWTEPIDA